jgi:hypothetical protein
VSLLERLRHGHLERLSRGHLPQRLWRGHLNDQQFARLWTTGGGHPHLEGCAACRARFEEFDRWIMGVGDELRAEADEAFPADRLTLQQTQIARRLETLERPARVIAFPKAARAVISGHSHVRRWVTVAAAASLITGFGLGQVVPLRTLRAPGAATVQPPLTTTQTGIRAKELTTEAALHNEDDLLLDAFAQPQRVPTLSALDEMTPHARDAIK